MRLSVAGAIPAASADSSRFLPASSRIRRISRARRRPAKVTFLVMVHTSMGDSMRSEFMIFEKLSNESLVI
jgi:hypothetical protein